MKPFASRDRERGAVALIVAVVLGMGSLLGMAALTVDVGAMSHERRQLQNGADAGALAAALQCAKTNACPSDSSPDLKNLADANDNSDTNTALARSDGGPAVCGHDPNNTLPSCGTVASKLLQNCPDANLPADSNFVRVYTRTPVGDTLLPSIFAQSLTGSSTGTFHQACAAAAWGPPANFISTLPFTLSACEWRDATGSGATYPTAEIAIELNGSNDAPCSFNGHDQPGGFGWLAPTPNCQSKVDANGWVSVSTGVSPPSGCSDSIKATVGQVAYVPVYDCQSNLKVLCDNTANGSNANYHILGLAAFFITAVDVTGQLKANLPGYPTAAAKAACQAKGGNCLYGYFLKDLVPTGTVIGPPGTPNLGATVIQMAG